MAYPKKMLDRKKNMWYDTIAEKDYDKEALLWQNSPKT